MKQSVAANLFAECQSVAANLFAECPKSVNKCLTTLFIVLFILTHSCHIKAQCNCDTRRDSLALVSLYNATKGADWKNKWNLTSTMRQWWGISLNNKGCVEVLDFDGENNGLWSENGGGNNLDGTIPADIGNLCQTQIISFNDNPLLKGTIPAAIGNLKALRFLYIEDCKITGPLPTDLWSLIQLEELSFANNPLNIPIPPQIGNLQKLDGLNMARCQLYGTIPSEIGTIQTLKRLFLSSNTLTGAIPASFKTSNISQFVWSINALDSMPDLSNMLYGLVPFHGEPYAVAFTNRFTFDDILPNMIFKNKNGGSFDYAPQDSIFKDTTLNTTTGNEVLIDLKIDGAITNNVYNWYKNGILFQTSSKNTLILRGGTACDNGTYTVKVTNPNAPDLTLNSRKIRLIVSGETPKKSQDITIQASENYTLPSGKNATKTGIYRDTFKSKSGCDSLIFTTNLTVKDNTNLTVDEKPLGITPNGDGLNDYLVFDNIQSYPDKELSILNRWGQVVFQQKNYDNTWQGTNQNGAPLPDGTYYFVLQLDKTKNQKRIGDVAIVR